VVEGVSEFDLGENTSRTSLTSAEHEIASDNSKQEIKERLKAALSDVSDVIDNAEAAADSKLTDEQIVALKNRIAALEKEIINLGATVSK
jgi:flagellar hook-basal body complex protein FliE